MSHACHRFWKCYKTLTFCSLLRRCTIPCACHAKAHLNLQKWSENGVFCTFWFGNVLRATTACTFFDISSFKRGPSMVYFVHFDFEMCFTRQRRALFRHRNFQKWSENGVFCTFWFGNVLRVTTVCNFSSLIWPDGSAPAALASLLFDPPEPKIIGKTQCFATSFFWPFLFSDLLSSALLSSTFLFSLTLLPDSSHLCFSSVHLSEVWLLNFLRVVRSNPSIAILSLNSVGSLRFPGVVFLGLCLSAHEAHR